MSFIKKNKPFLILVVLAVVFFFVYSYLSISQLNWLKHNNSDLSLRFNTPDEVINYYFTNQYTETGELYYFEPLDNFMNRVVFPRWAYVIDGRITPGNFMGIDLIYGTIAKIFSIGIIPFLTPLFAVIGVLFFYLLIKNLFSGLSGSGGVPQHNKMAPGRTMEPTSERVAFISALLVFIFPGFWYYASRTMFHNVLFLSLLIVALYLLIKLLHADLRGCKSRFTQICLAIFAGLFFGLAIITRTSEIVWVFLMVLAILIFYWKKLKSVWLYLLLSLIIFTACFIPVLYNNKILYDNYFSTGYPLHTSTENLESGEVSGISFLKAVFLPFGFHPRVIITHAFYKYIFKLFWPWLILWLVGLVVFLKDVRAKALSYKYFYLLLIPFYLFLYYGSWFFRDALDPDLVSIGSSYVRYFLPMFVFSMPLIGFLSVKVSECPVSKKKIIYLFLIPYFLFLLIYSGYQVLYSGPESLTATKQQLIKYQTQATDLLQYIDKDDIILMGTGTDKVLFPERKHLIVPQNGVEWPEVQRILPYKNVYYFHHTQEASQDYLNEIKFNPQGLSAHSKIDIMGGGVLYKLNYK